MWAPPTPDRSYKHWHITLCVFVPLLYEPFSPCSAYRTWTRRMGPLNVKKKTATHMRRVRLLVQAGSLGLFLWLLWQTAFPLAHTPLPVDSYLRLDPLATSLVPVAAREWIPALLPGLLALPAALIFGRIFCGYICPMGSTLELSRRASSRGRLRSISLPASLKHLKYLALALLLASALCGVSHIFWGSPIALVTRFYALLIHPLLGLLGKTGLDAGRSWLEALDGTTFAYMQIPARRFAGVYFIFAFFGLLFVLERIRPRFWCRYLCPAGALLALLSFRPLWRRRVHACVHCGKCVAACPTGAILPQGDTARHAECLACRTCVDVCPIRGVRFSCTDAKQADTHRGRRNTPPENDYPQAGPEDAPANLARAPAESVPALPSRRAFLASATAGAGLAALGHISAASTLPVTARGSSEEAGLVRPPGARPEADFLARCLRCGQCMKACPSNGLQPIWFVAGVEGLFSPALTARIGPCEPECAACGAVCPTGALIALPLEEKRQAKIGTAVVRPDLCLAWAEGRSCVVCQEVCPYGAVSLEQKDGSRVPAPVVNAARCFGCGYCEHHCPVRIPAITVQPLNALRLRTAGYRDAARAAGLDLVPVALRPATLPAPQDIPEGQLPPGFTE